MEPITLPPNPCTAPNLQLHHAHDPHEAQLTHTPKLINKREPLPGRSAFWGRKPPGKGSRWPTAAAPPGASLPPSGTAPLPHGLGGSPGSPPSSPGPSGPRVAMAEAQSSSRHRALPAGPLPPTAAAIFPGTPTDVAAAPRMRGAPSAERMGRGGGRP